MITLFKGGDVYAPEFLGRQDVLVAGSQILAMAPEIKQPSEFPVKVVDASDCIICPGLVDSLVHVAGGGGEGGFTTRTPEMQLSQATARGITTVVGALGTDATTRTLTNLIAKTKELRALGLNAHFYTGSYQVPVKTLTQSIEDDIILIEECIGVGEVAISDHRGSHPTTQELMRLTSQARTAGMLSGKSGVVSVHVGDGETYLDPLHQVVAESEIPIRQFYPTHINRTEALFEAGLTFARSGGVIDFTTSTTEQILAQGEIDSAEALARAVREGISAEHLSLSSDGNASLPVFDKAGVLTDLQLADPKSLLDAVVRAHKEHRVALPLALTAATATPAKQLGLEAKGNLAVGSDADIILLEKESLKLNTVMVNGALFFAQGEVLKKGVFE